MSSGHPTPTTVMGSSVANSPIFAMFNNPQLRQLHAREDSSDSEEDRKPSVAYLDSLNAYRKRSRSSEDVGQPGKVKASKLDNGVNGHGNGNGHLNGYGYRNGSSSSLDDGGPPSSQDTTLMGSQTEEKEPADDPICYGSFSSILLNPADDDIVAGTPKAYSLITDEDHELMTPEEYTAYFEVFQAQSES